MRPTPDGYAGIAQLAIEHDLTLLHHDRDYEAIAKVSALRRTRV